jgi:hypothetical protein
MQRDESRHRNPWQAHNIVMRRSFFRHPRRNRERLAFCRTLFHWMQDQADLVVNDVATNDPESFTFARVEAVSNYYFGMQGLVGSLSLRCSSGSNSTCVSSASLELPPTL